MSNKQTTRIPITLSIESLWEVCTACDGSGTAPATPPPSSSFGRTVLAGYEPCQQCHGKRGKPTPTGQAIIDFLDRVRVP